MRLHLLLIAAALASPASALFTSCTLCKGGVGFKNPSGIVTTSDGLSASCVALTTTVGTLSDEACAELQLAAAEPCGCPVIETVEPVQTVEESQDFESLPVVETPAEPVMEDPSLCSICPNGEITNPTAFTLNNYGVPTMCQDLHNARASIPDADCARVQNFAATPCGCKEPEPEAYSCSICGNGSIGNMEGMIYNSRGSGRTCAELDATSANIPPELCPQVQNSAMEPCECQFPEGTMPTVQETEPTGETEIKTTAKCAICGVGAKMALPNGMLTTPNGQTAQCGALDANPKEISFEACANIQELAKDPCGCIVPYDQADPDAVYDIKDYTKFDPDSCHICGGPYQKVSNFESMVATPTGTFSCFSLYNAGISGAIPLEDCPAVQAEAQAQCGCYVDSPTEAPTETFRCPICEGGLHVTRFDAIADFVTGKTCGEFLEEAEEGEIDQDYCPAVQGMAAEHCGCSAAPSFPTEAPTQFECELCGPDKEILNLDAVAMLPNFQQMSCRTMQQRAESGLFPSIQCPRFGRIAEQYCGCKNKPYQYVTEEPEFYECDLCGNGLEVTNPNALVSLPNHSDRTCIDYMTDAMNGKISKQSCELLQPFTRGPCGCADSYQKTLPPKPIEHDNCFSDLGKIQTLERAVPDPLVPREYTLCPDTTFDLGVWGEDGEIKDGQPFIALRPNVIYRCGEDGDRMNNCILKGGDFGLASYDGLYNGLHEAVSNVEIQGLTFESQNLFSVLLKSAGDITFTGCAFKNNSNNVPVLMQWEDKTGDFTDFRRLEHGEKQVVTFQDCVFRDNSVDDSLSFPGIIENTFDGELIVKNCLFQDNFYGSSDNLADSGYAIRTFGHLTLESTCFIDNTFLNNGPILVYGAEFESYDNYVRSYQKDLACELGALFNTKDDMGEITPSCVESDASTCAFTQGPTPAPTYNWEDEPATEEYVNEAESSASMIGLSLLPMLLALSIPVFGL